MGFFDKIKQGLSKTASSISSVFTASELDDDFYDELEESLILADLGVDTTTKAVERLRSAAKERHLKTAEEARACLREILADMLNVGSPALRLDTKPSVVLVIGVNGVGKTTTIGKIANQLRTEGKRCFCALRIPSARRRQTSLRSGRSAHMRTSSVRTRAQTPQRSSLTPSRRQRHAARTSFSATRQDGCTTSRIL